VDEYPDQMNIKIKSYNADLLEKIYKETEMNPSQLIEYFLGLFLWYSNYLEEKNANIEKSISKNHMKKLLPFVNLSMELYLVGKNPFTLGLEGIF
jgi:hypothetical protein